MDKLYHNLMDMADMDKLYYNLMDMAILHNNQQNNPLVGIFPERTDWTLGRTDDHRENKCSGFRHKMKIPNGSGRIIEKRKERMSAWATGIQQGNHIFCAGPPAQSECTDFCTLNILYNFKI